MASGREFFVGPDAEPEKYRLVQQVGSGGEAQLWRAEIAVAGEWEPVAVKILRPDRIGKIDEWRARWSEQAELLHFIRHPGVVSVREHFEGPAMHLAGEVSAASQRSLYLVMNWVDGQPLREWLALHQTPEDYFEALRHLAQVADVLDYLHSGQATPSNREVLHGDITPANILITPESQAVLVDFGLVRLAGGVAPAAVEGTRGFMAPEVLREGRYSAASDRYALGAVTYFVLSGGQQPPTEPEELRAGLSAVPGVLAQPDLLEHLMEMFEPDPGVRPGAGDWIRMFRASGSTMTGVEGLRPSPTRAVPAGVLTESVPLGAEKQGRRKLVAAVLVLLVLAGGGVGYALTQGGGDREPETALAANDDTDTTEDSTTTTSRPRTTSTRPRTTTTRRATTTSTTVPTTTTTTAVDAQGNPITNHYLEEVGTVGNSASPRTGPLAINGTVYAHTIYDNTRNGGDSYEYDLGRHYGQLRAVIGLADSSPSDLKVQYEVFLDGERAMAVVIGLGQSEPIAIGLDQVLRMRLLTTVVGGESYNGYAGWGDAEIRLNP